MSPRQSAKLETKFRIVESDRDQAGARSLLPHACSSVMNHRVHSHSCFSRDEYDFCVCSQDESTVD